MATIQKSTIDLLNIQGTSAQLANVKTMLTNTQKAIFTNTDTKRMYLCEYGKDPVMLGADVQSVTYENGTLTITPVVGNAVSISLTIDDELSNLETKITTAIATAKSETLEEVANNYVNKSKIAQAPSDATDAVASAKALKTAVQNLSSAIQGKVNTVTGNLVDNSSSDNNPTVNFFSHYDRENNKIWFYKGTTQLSAPSESNTICSIDTTEFIYKGMIDDVSFDAVTKKLTIDFNTNAGITDIEIDMSSLVDTYTAAAGGGLSLSNNAFGIKLPNISGLFVNDSGLMVKIKQSGGLSVTQDGLLIDSANWLPNNVVMKVNDKSGKVVIIGGVTSDDESSGINVHTIDVHPKWYTIS